MKTKIALAVLALHLLAIDYVAFRADKAFRSYRATICPEVVTRESDVAAGQFLNFVQNRGDLMEISAHTKSANFMIHFYGCDANGHRYRLWTENR